MYMQNSHTSICTDSKYPFYIVVHVAVNVSVPAETLSGFQSWLWNMLTFPIGRRSIASCFTGVPLSPSLSCRLLLTETPPGLDSVLPEVFSPPYCFQYCCCVSCGRCNPGEQQRGNWDSLTEFNTGEGLNRRSRLLPRPVAVHQWGQKRSCGPRWMIIGAAMVCGW